MTMPLITSRMSLLYVPPCHAQVFNIFSLTCPVPCVIKISDRAGLDMIKHLDKRDDSVGLLSSRCYQLDGSAVDWSFFLAFGYEGK